MFAPGISITSCGNSSGCAYVLYSPPGRSLALEILFKERGPLGYPTGPFLGYYKEISSAASASGFDAYTLAAVVVKEGAGLLNLGPLRQPVDRVHQAVSSDTRIGLTGLHRANFEEAVRGHESEFPIVFTDLASEKNDRYSILATAYYLRLLEKLAISSAMKAGVPVVTRLDQIPTGKKVLNSQALAAGSYYRVFTIQETFAGTLGSASAEDGLAYREGVSYGESRVKEGDEIYSQVST
jgi:hypothetical protein